MDRPALFLDRDGVINIDYGYVSTIDKFEFIPGIFNLCRQAKQRGYLICVVTNQSGIGRGYYTEKDFFQLTDWMCSRFASELAPVDKVYFCPTHPDHGIGKYKVESLFRKPAPGMILQAVQEFDIDLSRSVFVGDKQTDIQAGVWAGVRYNLLYKDLLSSEVAWPCGCNGVNEFSVNSADSRTLTGIVSSLEQVIGFL